MTPDVIIDRLEHQLEWYDKESAHRKRKFKRLKTATLSFDPALRSFPHP